MPPDIPPELIQWFLQQQAALPKWSVGEQAYQPMDLGAQQGALNFNQDYTSWLFDPRMAAMAGPGAYDPVAMQMAMQQYDPGSNEGEQYLSKIATKNIGSPEAIIATAIMEGKTPDEAVSFALENLDLDPNDPAVAEKYGKTASTYFDKYMSDRSPTGTNDPFARAGLSQPTMQFTPEMFAPKLPQLQQSADADLAAVRQARAPMERAQQESMRLGQQAQARAMQDAVNFQRGGVQPPPMLAPPNPATLPPGALGNPSSGFSLESLMNAPAAAGAARPPVQGPKPGPGVGKAPNYGMDAATQNFARANARATKSQQSRGLEAMKAQAQANDSVNTYGSPMMMQLMQRMAAARQLGITP